MPRKRTHKPRPFKGQFKATPKGLTLIEIVEYFPTDEAARLHLETITWPNGPICPKCHTNDPERIGRITPNPAKKIREGLYNCRDCRRHFSVTVGTIFEDTHIPLRKWLIAWYLLCASKKGISSLQMQRMLDLGSYKSALFLMHRIRHALRDPVFEGKLNGDVEIDETYVGGKGERGYDPVTKKLTTGWENKAPVVSMVERDGTKRSFHADKLTAKNLHQAIEDNVHEMARIHTDESVYYKGLEGYEHHPVNHSKKQYVVRLEGFKAHTNTVESSFSLLKRGVYGTFHHISKHHLPLYLSEFDHRWNTRNDSDTERTEKGLAKSRGKRLTYKPLTRH